MDDKRPRNNRNMRRNRKTAKILPERNKRDEKNKQRKIQKAEKMKLSTKFWEETNIENAKEKTVKVAWIWMITLLTNIAHYTITENKIMGIINLIFLVFTILIIITHKKYKEKRIIWKKE